MMKNNWLSTLGLAMRAGKIVTGDDTVMKAVRSGEAKLVLLASDAAANAQKKYRDKCSFYNVPLIEQGSRFELGSAIGKVERVVLAVTDAGFANRIAQCQVKPAEVEGN
ncbi:YlxQ family RNA-binding protein [Gorillibacterium sp. sgz5001074]|uniref:YlxQ family RNA-binding protein n=1 Tax=Gorillibacterium sp. sgz5001074 TaxID=3446695 RepID=UPI003F674A61